uniref:Uncharacterized protein n=1 Tax=Myoviridae sp. ctCo31 TaxID=2825053 RepID=A0A8S5UME3_9CAUD|nr:MAG TPA: hypothetical protein [Myoviridae sp. ctCo31]
MTHCRKRNAIIIHRCFYSITYNIIIHCRTTLLAKYMIYSTFIVLQLS